MKLTITANNGKQTRKKTIQVIDHETAVAIIDKSIKDETAKFRKHCGWGLEDVEYVATNHVRATFQPVVMLFSSVKIDYVISD